MIWVKGRHTFKWGANAYDIWVGRVSKDTTVVTFASIDAFVRNQVAAAPLTPGDPGHTTRGDQIGLFFQDTFKARHNVAVDFGLRYDYNTVIHDKHGSTPTYDERRELLITTQTRTTGGPGSRSHGSRLRTGWCAAATACSGKRTPWDPDPLRSRSTCFLAVLL